MNSNISNSTLKKYAKMASEVFMEDPVYKSVCKNKWLRKKLIYHGVLIRLYDSAKKDFFYFDRQGRGMLVLKDVKRQYQISELMKCPNAMALIFLAPYVVKLFGILGQFNNRSVLGEDVYTISPVFVGKEYQRRGVAASLVKRAVADMKEKGLKVGLDTQNPVNKEIYERIGFTLVKQEFLEKEQIDNYYMLFE